MASIEVLNPELSSLSVNYSRDEDYLDSIDPDINLLEHYSSSCKYYMAADFRSFIKDRSLSLSILHCNIRSVASNMAQPSVLLSELHFNFSIIGLTETWLTEETLHLYSISSYNTYALCRPNHRGGGVSIYVKDTWPVQPRDDLNINEVYCECVFIELPNAKSLGIPSASDNIIIGTLYRPPGSDFEVFLEILQILRWKKIIMKRNLCISWVILICI